MTAKKKRTRRTAAQKAREESPPAATSATRTDDPAQGVLEIEGRRVKPGEAPELVPPESAQAGATA